MAETSGPKPGSVVFKHQALQESLSCGRAKKGIVLLL